MNIKNTIIAVLVIIILVIGYLFIKEKTKPMDYGNAWPETVPATPTNNNSQTIPAGDTANEIDNENSYPSADILSFNGDGFSFNHDAGVTVRSGDIPNGSYAELTSGNKFNSLKFYPGDTPSNFNSSFYTQTITINGKTFYYGSVVLNDGSTSTSYMYKNNGKTLVIQNNDLIDLGSIEIN